MNESGTYTATDIERYHNGQLSAAERYALERAALSDPFLADALEGYAFAKTPSTELAALQQRLQLRIEKEKAPRSIFPLNAWMKIAAMLVLMAGGGWLVWRISDTPSESIAIKQAPAPLPNSITALDSSTVSTDAPLAMQSQPAEQGKADKASRPAQDNLVLRKAPATIAAPPAGIMRQSIADSTQHETYASRETAASLQEVKVGTTADKSMTGNTALNEEKKEAVALRKPTAAPAEKAKGYVSTSTDTIRNVNVTLRRTELPADQTVVLKGMTKETPRTKRLNVTLDSLEPAGGWTQFDDYVSNNVKEPEEIKTKRVSGEVELSFDVNKAGEAVNITVTKSLCDKCDEEAIRLLKEGPKWKNNKKKGKVKIKFPAMP